MLLEQLELAHTLRLSEYAQTERDVVELLKVEEVPLDLYDRLRGAGIVGRRLILLREALLRLEAPALAYFDGVQLEG